MREEVKAVGNPSEGNVNKSESNFYYVKYHKETKINKQWRKRNIPKIHSGTEDFESMETNFIFTFYQLDCFFSLFIFRLRVVSYFVVPILYHISASLIKWKSIKWKKKQQILRITGERKSKDYLTTELKMKCIKFWFYFQN